MNQPLHPNNPSHDPVRRLETVGLPLRKPTGAREPKDRQSMFGVDTPKPVRYSPTIQSEGETEELTISDRWRRNRNPVHSAAVSLFIHTAIILVFAMVAMAWPSEEKKVILVDFVEPPDVPMEKEQIEQSLIEVELPEISNSLVEENMSESSMVEEVPLTDLLNQFEEAPAVETPINLPNEEAIAKDAPHATGGGLDGRKKGQRGKLAGRRGATAESEKSVELGLKWIINHQQYNGSWHLNFQTSRCNGRCSHPGTLELTTAATGLSLMALMGAGYTHQTGPYQREIEAGLNYLLRNMRKTYFGGNLSEGNMYAQAIATIALSEAYSMTGDPKFEKPLKLAQKYIINAQHSKGGWRYTPGEPGDTTVTGWQIMALKSCEISGLQTPNKTYTRAKSFFGTRSESGGAFYGYLDPEPKPGTTAVGLLAQMYMGWDRERPELSAGVDYIVDFGPSATDIYYNYYATLVMHHYGGEQWKKWNSRMRDFLVNSQDQQGHQIGSWHFHDRHGNMGGRLYTTAMAVMILEVYYRYLPLFEEGGQ